MTVAEGILYLNDMRHPKTSKTEPLFTPRAKQVLALARKEADRFNHNYVGTEHLLLGLIKLGQGIAVNMLHKQGLDLETVRMEVEKHVGSHPQTEIVGNLPYTARVKKVLALAIKEARALNHPYVGTEHIFLGTLQETEGGAGRVFSSLQLDLETIRNEVLMELDASLADGDENKFAQHPLVRLLDVQIEGLKSEEASAIKAQDLDKVAVLRGRQDNLLERKRQLIRSLRDQRVGVAEVLAGQIGRFCREIVPREGFPTWNVTASVIARRLSAGSSTILVSNSQVDALELANQVAFACLENAMHSQVVPETLIVPNHLMLEEEGKGEERYEQNLHALCDAVLANRNLHLCLPDAHLFAGSALIHTRTKAAWQHFLKRLIDQKRSFLAWTTATGAEQIHIYWPGIIASAQFEEMPSIPREGLLGVVLNRLADHGCRLADEEKDSIASALIARSERLIEGQPMCEWTQLCDQLAEFYFREMKRLPYSTEAKGTIPLRADLLLSPPRTDVTLTLHLTCRFLDTLLDSNRHA